MPFPHLHVASGWSLRHGAASPELLVEVAADLGLTTLGLTDRDGVRGAVRFARAAMSAGIETVFGADLALAATGWPGAPSSQSPPSGASTRRTPARGGRTVDHRPPRVTVLANGPRGWGALCRLVSAAHARGELLTDRGNPVVDHAMLAEHCASGDLIVLLGPDSDIGRMLAARRHDLASARWRQWRDHLPELWCEVVNHRGADPAGRSAAFAGRMLGWAHELQAPVVLTNTVRYARREDAPVADVLDASRRLVPLDVRHIDRRTGEGYLKPSALMAEVAAEVARHSGVGDERATTRSLLEATERLAGRCVLDPIHDLGLGSVHFPELEVVDPQAAASQTPSDAVLLRRCEAGWERRGLPREGVAGREARERLDHELGIIAGLGYATYFLTVADVVDLIRSMQVRVAARGSGAGSLVTYLLGISGVDPIRHDLLFERFLSPLRQALPDIDVDVESARRTEIYTRIFERYGTERVACVSMADTYRVRHAIRDVGAALGLPPSEIDTLAKAFPHIRARDAQNALRELPELRASRIADDPRLMLLFSLVERLDGLPRHLALHPCGVLLSDITLLDRTPVESSAMGFAMSQFDKDDVEHLGLLKLDVLGIRMQSAMAYALDEIERVEGAAQRPDLDAVPFDDPVTHDLIRSTHTLGCFQIESPGQRELVGKFAPENFDDLVIDISLFRPGPVKSDMVNPFLRARHGWAEPEYLHPDLAPVLRPTYGVVVFHEQVIDMLHVITGCSRAEGDEKRRALGDPDGQAETREWFYRRAHARGYDLPTIERIWEVLRAFASFGFCKAHAAAFAVPTYQSAWLKAHHTASFLAGVLTHDPGMYPKRLILDDARQFGITVLPVDVNSSRPGYRVERVESPEPPESLESLAAGSGAGSAAGAPHRVAPQVDPVLSRSRGILDHPQLPDARGYGIRIALAEVKGISEAEVERVIAGQPYQSLTDFWHRASVSRPVVERLVIAGGFDALHGIDLSLPVAAARRRITRRDLLLQVAELDRWKVLPSGSQLPLPIGPSDEQIVPSGLPEMTGAERVRAELEVLGLDASRHVVDFYVPMLRELMVVRSRDLLTCRSRSEILVAGVKVATQTPPIRSGRRVVFVTLDDATGPVDATFFDDAQGPYAATLFHSWLLVIRGEVRRTGPRGVSLRATGCWELTGLYDVWQRGGAAAVYDLIDTPPPGFGAEDVTAPAGVASSDDDTPSGGATAGGMGRRRVLVHPSGFKQSPYADVKPAGGDVNRGAPPRKLWHSSPGSSGQ